MRSGRTVAAIATSLALTLGFVIDAGPASATTTYTLDPQGAQGALCINSAAHTYVYRIRFDDGVSCGSFAFILGEVYNGNNWWLVKDTKTGLCLNWLPTDTGVYADSCIVGDRNEEWYNHVAGQLINLQGNLLTGHNTYLNWSQNCCVYGVFADNTPWTSWAEIQN